MIRRGLNSALSQRPTAAALRTLGRGKAIVGEVHPIGNPLNGTRPNRPMDYYIRLTFD
jgi:hypothetical protein